MCRLVWKSDLDLVLTTFIDDDTYVAVFLHHVSDLERLELLERHAVLVAIDNDLLSQSPRNVSVIVLSQAMCKHRTFAIFVSAA